MAPRLTPYLRDHHMKWDDLNKFLRLRSELFEIDTRFAQIGPDGIFSSMEQAGVLSHGLVDMEHIEQAMISPPTTTRANLRGRIIKKMADCDGRYLCSWDFILDSKDHRILEMSDPFVSTENWVSLSKETMRAGQLLSPYDIDRAMLLTQMVPNL